MTTTTKTIPKGLPALAPKPEVPAGWTMTTLGDNELVNVEVKSEDILLNIEEPKVLKFYIVMYDYRTTGSYYED